MPKLSIIIGAFQAHKYIEECLQSIQNQTAFRSGTIDYEILIGIDGCQMTLDKVLYLQDKCSIHESNPSQTHESNPDAVARLSRVTPLNNTKVFYMPKNQGVYITFNTLLSKATGTHILFFGADDIMFPNMVEKCFEYGCSSSWNTIP